MPSIISVSTSDWAGITPVSYWVVSTVHDIMLSYFTIKTSHLSCFLWNFLGFD